MKNIIIFTFFFLPLCNEAHKPLSQKEILPIIEYVLNLYKSSSFKITKSASDYEVYRTTDVVNNYAIDITVSTTNILSELYDSTHNDITTVKLHLDNFMGLLNDTYPKKVLDVGCGPGRDVHYFVDHGLEAIGIDLSERTLERAREHVPQAEFFAMDMRSLKFSDETFSGIWSCGSFYHIPKDYAGQVLDEFLRVLKPGGVLFLAVKKGEGQKFVFKDEYANLPKFYAFYTIAEIKSLIESHGFTIQTVIAEEKKDSWINIYAIKK